MRTALNEFLVRLRSIETTITLRDRLVAFGQQSPENLAPGARTLHRSVTRIGLAGLQPSLDGAVLLIAAALEQFVSDLMVAFAATLPNAVPDYNNLPNAIRSANERLTGEALSRNRSRFTNYELQRFVENLRNCHKGNVPYVLNGEAMALNDRNLRAGTLQDLISRLGIDDVWSVVASTRTLQRWSGRGGAKVAASRAKNHLNELITYRNQIAHRVSTPTLGPETIRSHIRFQRALARSMVKGLEDNNLLAA